MIRFGMPNVFYVIWCFNSHDVISCVLDQAVKYCSIVQRFPYDTFSFCIAFLPVHLL